MSNTPLITITATKIIYTDEDIIVFGGIDYKGLKHKVVAQRRIVDTVWPGDTMTLSYKTIEHPIYGKQIHIYQFIRMEMPTAQTGRLLAALIMSGQGVGQKTADRLIDEFGVELLIELLETQDIDRLSDVKGISILGAETVCRAWHDQAGKKAICEFFMRHMTCEIDGPQLTKIIHKVYRFYGSETISKIENDPYRIWAFATWRECEILASSLNVNKDDPKRLKCAVEEILYRLYSKGHTAVSKVLIDQELNKLLGEYSVSCQSIFDENQHTLAPSNRVVVDHNGKWSLPGPYMMERYVEIQLNNRIFPKWIGSEKNSSNFLYNHDQLINIKDIIDNYKLPGNYTLDQSQKDAVLCVMEHDFAVISGPAGAGKTSVLFAVNDLIQRSGRNVLQVALTGKAAQRLIISTEKHAYTIEGLLKKVEKNNTFLDQFEMPVLHIDEASMVDLPLMYRVLRAFEGRHVKIVMIGDEAQLPPIGPGAIFHHLITMKNVPSVRLQGNYRQGAGSSILDVANQIRHGIWPTESSKDVSFIKCSANDALSLITDLYLKHIDKGDEIFVVPATRKLVANTNDQLHRILRKFDPCVPTSPEFKINDPVVYKQNRPNLGLVNGSFGKIVEVKETDAAWRTVKSSFNGKDLFGGDIENKFMEREKFKPDIVIEFVHEGRISLLQNEIKTLGERLLQHAYAITCHQAQGSEFGVAIVPVFKTKVLDRSWIYTALTRAKYKLYFIGDIDAARYAVENIGNSVTLRQVGFKL